MMGGCILTSKLRSLGRDWRLRECLFINENRCLKVTEQFVLGAALSIFPSLFHFFPKMTLACEHILCCMQFVTLMNLSLQVKGPD